MLKIGRRPRDSGVAVVAYVAAGNMCLILARRDNTVVTGRTTTEYLGVIDGRRRNPYRRGMAVLTIVGGLYMRWRFSGCVRTVVAGDAIGHDIDVIKVCGKPSTCRMAVITIIAARDMHRSFAGCRIAVMAGAAAAQYLGMIDGRWRHPDRHGVAGLTHVRCPHVLLRLARRVRAVMASGAAACDVHMVEIRGHPSRGCMTVDAVVAARYMRRVPAGCDDTVVAGLAATQNLRVINGHHRTPVHRRMAVLANSR